MLDLQGWFGVPEAECYKDLVKNIKNGKVVEVGCWKGLSTSHIGKICNDNNTWLVVVDTFKGSDNNEEKGIAENEDIMKIFMDNMKELGIWYTIIPESSVEASKYFADESLDLVMLDASHLYEHIMDDLLTWTPKVKKGGWMCGHDIEKEGVRNAVHHYYYKNYEVKNSSIGPCWWQWKKQ